MEEESPAEERKKMMKIKYLLIKDGILNGQNLDNEITRKTCRSTKLN